MHRRFLLYSFLSGLSALIYEITWVRVLSVIFGSTTYSISSVLAVFMAGLAIGNSIFGRRIDRSDHPLRTYAVIEIGLAAMAMMIAVFVPAAHLVLARWLVALPPDLEWLTRIVLTSVVLLPPAILMGGTLPVLSKCIADLDRTRALQNIPLPTVDRQSMANRIAQVYGLNTLGAVVGCCLAAMFLIPSIGIRMTILLGAALNFVIGCLAWKDAGYLSGVDSIAQQQLPQRLSGTPRTDVVKPLADQDVAGALIFVCGFVSLAAEVVWTRLLINQLSGNVLVFAMILAAFLAGMGIAGVAVGRWFRVTHARSFLAILLAMNGTLLLMSVTFQAVPAELFDWIHRTGAESSRMTSLVCLAALFLMLLPATTALGCVCPWILAMQTTNGTADRTVVGRIVGRLLSWNTVGAILGSLLAGFVMLNAMGANHSLFVLAMVCFAASIVTALRAIEYVTALASITGIAMCVVALSGAASGFAQPIWFNAGFTRVCQLPEQDVRFFAEGAEGTVVVTADHNALRLLVNGVVVADSSREDMWDLLLKAHLPMLLHPDPKRVAVVGLGAGISLGAIEAYDEVDSVDCIELCSEVVEAHQMFGSFNGRCWEDQRLRLYTDDGRHFLLKSTLPSQPVASQPVFNLAGTKTSVDSPPGYDIINVDPIDPPVCNQYTQEFVQICFDRLNPGGMMVQWIPLFHLNEQHLRSMSASFVNVFPNTTMWYDGTSILLIGRKGAGLQLDLDLFVARGRRDRVRENLAVIGRPDPLILLGTFVCGSQQLQQWIGTSPANTDDCPWLEYELLLAGPLRRSTFLQNLKSVRCNYEPLSSIVESPADDLNVAVQVRAAMSRLLDARIAKYNGDYKAADRMIESAQTQHGLTDSMLETLAPLLAE